jgi:hypothetical protein
MITFQRILVATFALAGLAMAEAPAISFNRPPHYIAEGYAHPFELRIPRNADNRRIEFSAIDRRDGERVSHEARDLDGGSAALQVFKTILPRGDLLVVGQLYLFDRERGLVVPGGRTQTRVRVLSPYNPPEDDELGVEP